MRITLTLIAILVSLRSFAQTADITQGCAPLQVSFTPPAGSSGFFWDFKDGGSSNLSAPTNIFTSPGTYQVDFKNTPGGPIVGSTTITVFPKPVIGITADPAAGCRPLAVKFNDTTQINPNIQILSRNWVFGDGNSLPNVANPNYTYFTTGFFTVSVEYVTNFPSCNVTAVFPDFVKAGSKPSAGFTTTPNPAIACVPPLAVSFTNTTIGGSGNLSYAWDFGNGNTSVLANPPAQTYTTTGSFKVRLLATDAFGCVDSVSKTIKIGNPEADFFLPDTVCYLDTLVLDNLSDAGVYNWDFGPNATPSTSTAFEPTVVFTQGGPQTISLKVTAAGNCSGTFTKTIFVEKPDASFAVSPSFSCSDPSTFNFSANAAAPNQWSWAFSDGTTSNLQNPTYIYHFPDTTGYTKLGLALDTVMLTVTTPAGCTDTRTKIDSIWLPNARFMPNVQHGCAPLLAIFADSSKSQTPIVSWTWFFDDGTAPLISTTGADVIHIYNNPGEYHVRLAITNSNGCIDTSYAILIEVGAPISGDFSVDKQEICPGDTVQFKNLTNDPRIDGWHFSSDNDRLFHCYQNSNPFWVYESETGDFDVSLTIDYNGCLQTVTKSDWVKVKGPVAQIHYKTTCDNSLLFDFTDESHDATKITWYLGDGDSSLLSSFNHLYDRGTYQVVLKAENPASGCPISFDTATVYATQVKSEFNLPDTICGDTNYDLDGTKSTNVNAVCYKGYTWYFSFQRPIRTSEPVTEFGFGPSGPQTIWLEVEDINGCKDTSRQDFVVYNRKPSFTLSDPSICLPGKENFTDTSTGDAPIISWEWNFGDGNTSNQQNPMHTYTTPPASGTIYTVQLGIRDDKGCYGAATQEISLYQPVSFITPQLAQICEDKTVNFSATDFTVEGSNLSWTWDFGNGGTATGQSVSQAYSNAGTFIVTLKFTEIATGCKGETTVPVQVQAYPQAAFTSNVDGQNIICYPQNMQFTNTSVSNNPLATIWNLGNGVTATGNTAATVYPKGTFTVNMITATSFGCADTTQRSFTIVGPEGNFNLDKSFICKGDDITFTLIDTVDISSYSWSFGDGTTLDNTSPTTHTYSFQPPSGQTTAKLILTGEDAACTTVVEKLINFSLVNADFIPQDSSVCLGLSHIFLNNSTAADQSQWTFGDGSSSGNNSPAHTYASIGNFPVTLIITDLPLGCKDTITRNVAIEALPDLLTFGDTICLGDTATIGLLFPSQGNTYTWTPSNLILSPSNGSFVQVVPQASTQFVVNVTDAQGCKGVDTAYVFVPQAFTGAQNLDTLVAQGQPVTLPVTYDPNFSFMWTPDPGNLKPPVVSSEDSSLLFKLKVSDVYGCANNEFTFNIKVIPEKVWAPNVFTPNGDTRNDVFKLLAAGEQDLVTVTAFKIFNRWGQVVFEASGNLKTVSWDGKFKGEDAPVDVYVWKAEVRYLTGKEDSLSGQISLIR